MIYVQATGMVNALGNGLDEIASNLQAARAPGLQHRVNWLQHNAGAIFGCVDGGLPAIPDALAAHRSRNNQLLLAALQPMQEIVRETIARVGSARFAIVLGTSTSGLDEGDQHVRATAQQQSGTGYHYYQQELGDPSRFLRHWLGTHGPAFTLSTACSSSARAVISGRRLLEAGLADAVLVGGADSLSRMPVNGFNSLESLSAELCQPFARDRKGITIGEGAALMLLTRTPADIALLGVGESSDAWHISAPHPQGEGAIRAISQALADADLPPQAVGYINLHGTATRLNDQIESSVVHQLFGEQVPCSSTKHLTGHTLGAAGINEAVLCTLLLQRELALPAQDFSRSPLDESLPAFGLLQRPGTLHRPVIMSNSFAFGGNNASLIFGRCA